MITFNELLERAESERIVVHTPTEEQAKALLKSLDKRGYAWGSGAKLTTTTHYEDEKENTCYAFYKRYGKLLDKKVMYNSFEFYQEEGYTIIEFSEINFEENKI